MGRRHKLKRKTAKCPKCLPNDVGAIFYLKGNYNYEKSEKGEWETFWECANCGHCLPRGAKKVSPKAVEGALNRIREAIEKSGSEAFPTEIVEWKVDKTESGDTHLMVRAQQGGKDGGNMLSVLSSRTLGIKISQMGGIKLYFDSGRRSLTEKTKAEEKKELKVMEKQLRQGRIYVW